MNRHDEDYLNDNINDHQRLVM
nr:hypothetical protein [Salmonella sp.]